MVKFRKVGQKFLREVVVSTEVYYSMLRWLPSNDIKIVVVCAFLALRKVSGSDLTSRQKMQYLWPLSNRGYSWAISVSGSHGTSYRHEH